METKSIGEVSQVNLSQIRRTHEGPISYIDTSSVIYGKFSFPKIYSSVQDAPSRARRLAKSGDTVISTVRPKMCHYGYISSVNEKDIFSTGFVVVHPRRQVIEPYYLYLVLTSDEVTEKLQQIAETSTTTYPSIKPSDITSIDIIIPSRKYQQDVAGIIGAIDEKIVLNQQINKNLLKLSVLGFNKWLDSTQSNQYTSLDKIASFKNGIAMQKFSPTDKIHVLPVIKIRELNQGYIDSNSDSVTSVIDDDVKVHNGDLVFSWSGTLSAKIWTDGDAALNQHLFKVTSNRWPKWFYYLWVLHHLNTFRGIAADKKTTMGHIKRKDLTNAKVLIPNAKEFKNLDTILNPIIEQMVNGGIESKNLIDMRNILLPKLLSGSMDLSSIEETINND